METVKASSTWSPETNVYCLYAEPPAPSFAAEPGGTPLVAVLWELDEQERETGRVAGVEIVGLLDFEQWDALPRLPIRWQLPGWQPLPLDELLKRQQAELRRQRAEREQGAPRRASA